MEKRSFKNRKSITETAKKRIIDGIGEALASQMILSCLLHLEGHQWRKKSMMKREIHTRRARKSASLNPMQTTLTPKIKNTIRGLLRKPKGGGKKSMGPVHKRTRMGPNQMVSEKCWPDINGRIPKAFYCK